MSTKVYTGFRIHSGSPLKNLKVLRQLPSLMQELVDNKKRNLIAAQFATAVDSFIAFNTFGMPIRDAAFELDRNPLYSAESQIDTAIAEAKASPYRSPAFDCELTLSYWVADRGVLLGMCHGEIKEALPLLLAQQGIEDYSYWNNSDAPDDVSSRAWAIRGKAWDKVWADPSNDQATFLQVFNPSYKASQNILAHVPSFDARVKSIAHKLVAKEYYALHDALPLVDQQAKPPSYWLRLEMALRKDMDNPESESGKRFAHLTALAATVLPQSLKEVSRQKLSDLELPTVVDSGLPLTPVPVHTN